MSKNPNNTTAQHLVNLFYQKQDPLPSTNSTNKLVVTPERQKIVNLLYEKFEGKLPLSTPAAQQNAELKTILGNKLYNSTSALNRKFAKNLLYQKGGKRKTARRNANQKRKTRKV